MTTHNRLVRQYQILSALSRARVGLTAAQLKAVAGTSKSTFQRDLDILRSAGIPIDLSNGRYRFLNANELPPLGLSALQIASLHLARAQLVPVAGTALLKELDRFLASLKGPTTKSKARQIAFHFADSRKKPAAPQILRTIEKALGSRRRACIEYRAASRGGISTRVHIEPLVLSIAEGEPYVRAYCIEREQERTYKLARIVSAEITRERSTYRPKAPAIEAFSHSIKAWSGPPRKIKVRLDASVAWLASEHPLPGQVERAHPNGSVTLEATVAGLIEAQRRILAWGSAAEVLEPPELRQATRAELAKALEKYDSSGPTQAPKLAKGKSTKAPERSLKQGGAGVS